MPASAGRRRRSSRRRSRSRHASSSPCSSAATDADAPGPTPNPRCATPARRSAHPHCAEEAIGHYGGGEPPQLDAELVSDVEEGLVHGTVVDVVLPSDAGGGCLRQVERMNTLLSVGVREHVAVTGAVGAAVTETRVQVQQCHIALAVRSRDHRLDPGPLTYGHGDDEQPIALAPE